MVQQSTISNDYELMEKLFDVARLRQKNNERQLSPLGFNKVTEEVVIESNNNYKRKNDYDDYIELELLLMTKPAGKINRVYTLQLVRKVNSYDQFENKIIQTVTRVPLSIHLLLLTFIKFSDIKEEEEQDICNTIIEILTICEIKLNNYEGMIPYIDKVGLGMISYSSDLTVKDIGKELEVINANILIVSNVFYTGKDEELIDKLKKINFIKL